MTKTVYLNNENFDETIESGVALVDFYADWCPPCKALGPTIDTLADKTADKALVAKVNIDENPELAQRFGVRSIPTIVALKNATEVGRLMGNVPLGQLEELLEDANSN